IDLAEFNQLLNIIAIKFQEESEPWLSRYSFCNSVYSEMLKGFVKSPKFKYVIVFVLLQNLAALIAETRIDIQNKSGHKSCQKVDFVFGKELFMTIRSFSTPFRQLLFYSRT
ncbi:hypothetical protein Tco_1445433, partial [Tanacetum coccineum]